MKTKIRGSLLLVLLLVLGACSDDDEKLTLAVEEQPLLLELDIDRIALDQSISGNPAVTLRWNEADYGLPTQVTYVVQLSMDNSFSTKVDAATTRNTTVTWTVSTLNSAVSSLGLAPFEWAEVFVRVKSTVGTTGSLETFSAPISLEVNPYFSYPFEDLFLVGSATAPGWNNNNNNPVMFRDPFDDNSYSYTGFFTGEQVKLLKQRGEWAPQYGQEGGELRFRPTNDDPDPAPIDVPAQGYFTFQVNTASNQYSFDPLAQVGNALNSLSITGNNGNVAMTQLAFDPHIWYINSTPLNQGSLQFLANGSTTWGGSTEFSGTATPGGDQVPVVVADDYEIWFNDITGKYLMIPINLSK